MTMEKLADAILLQRRLLGCDSRVIPDGCMGDTLQQHPVAKAQHAAVDDLSAAQRNGAVNDALLVAEVHAVSPAFVMAQHLAFDDLADGQCGYETPIRLEDETSIRARHESIARGVKAFDTSLRRRV